MDLIVVGTDTDVGKTYVTQLLVHGLRALKRQVWVHKPVACGNWQDGQADDGRSMQALADPQQDPALVCPLQYPAAASPHLAAHDQGAVNNWRDMANCINDLRGEHDLVIEAAGGILAPLSTDGGTICDIAADLALPVLVVTRPHLGTLNHSQLTVRELQRHNIPVLGLCINDHQADLDLNSLALKTVDRELEQLCQVPICAHITHDQSAEKCTLAQSLIGIHAEYR
ncbi:MAG: dethiobiotin synthase [Planctomycetes bacterium]|nr:dethiobiotin synthase [Planctomycetota bacterium]